MFNLLNTSSLCPFFAGEKKISSKLPKTEVPPRPRVRELALVRVPLDPADDAEALIDGLLWSCQPMQVRVQMSHENDYDNNFIKVTLLIRRSIICSF